MIDPQLREESIGPVNNRVLRQFAALWTLLFSVLAYWRGFAHGNVTWGYVFIAISLLGIAGLAIPAIIRPVFVTATLVTRPIGWVVSHIILLAIYFIVFTPVALIFKLIGRDALTRQFQPELESYWIPKQIQTDARSYMRLS